MKNSQLANLVNILNSISTSDDIDLGFKIADISEQFTSEFTKFNNIKKTLALSEEEKKYGVAVNEIETSNDSPRVRFAKVEEIKKDYSPSIIEAVAKKNKDLVELLQSDLRESFKHGFLSKSDLTKLKKMKSLNHLNVGDLGLFRTIIKK